MKTIGKFLLCLICVAMLTNCERDDFKPAYNDQSRMDPYNFIADYRATDVSSIETTSHFDEKEGSIRRWLGNGQNNLFGEFEVEIMFVCFIKPGEICGEFSNMSGIFTAEDGSSLMFGIAQGEIVMNEDENHSTYQTCINNKAEIIGGSGKFAGTKGNFYPHAYIHNGQDELFVDFFSRGYITKGPNQNDELQYEFEGQ